MQLEEGRSVIRRLIAEIETVIVGKRGVVEEALIALLAQGHLLIEDVPGTGKTMLARSIARSIDGSFRRIQFTPDLLPADITGTSIYSQKTAEFEFRPGPVFANVVLADEINRATPKTQSSLLEAMEEFQVSVDGVSRPLPRPFFVIATQNSIEYHGTFPLPEAQLDRFVMRVAMGYPSPADEVSILRHQARHHPIEDVRAVVTAEEVLHVRDLLQRTRITDAVREYIVDIVNASRESPLLSLGGSPRASIDLMHCAQVRALMDGRDYVLPDDIKSVAGPTLSHRIVLNSEARLRRMEPEQVVREILRQVPVPITEEPA